MICEGRVVLLAARKRWACSLESVALCEHAKLPDFRSTANGNGIIVDASGATGVLGKFVPWYMPQESTTERTGSPWIQSLIGLPFEDIRVLPLVWRLA